MKKTILENEGDILVAEEHPKHVHKNRTAEASNNDVASRSIENELAKRKALLKNVYKGAHNQSLNVTPEQPEVDTISTPVNRVPVFSLSDLLIFELNDDHTAIKTDWIKLPLRLKEVFEEIMYSLPVSGISNPDDDGCYTFSYADDEYNLSVISVVIEGKAALFYKNADSSES